MCYPGILFTLALRWLFIYLFNITLGKNLSKEEPVGYEKALSVLIVTGPFSCTNNTEKFNLV